MVNKTLLTMGQIIGIHGLKGYVKVKSHAASHASFPVGGAIFVGTSVEQGAWYTIAGATPHKKGLLMWFDGVDVNKAEGLVGKDLFALKDDLPDLDADTYYWDDLIGMVVTDIHQGHLGVIDHVMATGSNDVFVVREKRRETLVPFLAHVVLSVDLENKRMTVDLPEGL